MAPKEEFADVAGAWQLGIGVSGGVETAAHVVQAFLARGGRRSAITVDVVNAHNAMWIKPALATCSENVVLARLAVPLVWKLLGRGPIAVQFTDMNGEVEKLRSHVGFPQGAAIASMLWAAGARPVVEAVLLKHPECQVVGIHDDLTILSLTPAAGLACTEELMHAFRTELGMMISLSSGPVGERTEKGKTALLCREELQGEETFHANALGVEIVPREGGVRVVGARVGSPDYVRREFTALIREVVESIQRAARLNDTQTALLLIRICLIPRATWFGKVTPYYADLTADLDEGVAGAMDLLLHLREGTTFGTRGSDTPSFDQMSLPLRLGGGGMSSVNAETAGRDFFLAALQAMVTCRQRGICLGVADLLDPRKADVLEPRPGGAPNGFEIKNWRFRAGMRLPLPAGLDPHQMAIADAFLYLHSARVTVELGDFDKEQPIQQGAVKATLGETIQVYERCASKDRQNRRGARVAALGRFMTEAIYEGVTNLVMQRQADYAADESDEAKNFRSNAHGSRGPQASKTFEVLPTSPGCVIPPRQMRALWALRFFLPLEGMKRIAGGRCACGKVIDIYGIHAQSCPKSSRYNERHYTFLTSLARLFKAAGLHVQVEPKYWVAALEDEVQEDGGGSDTDEEERDEEEEEDEEEEQVQAQNRQQQQQQQQQRQQQQQQQRAPHRRLRPDAVVYGMGLHGADVALDVTFTAAYNARQSAAPGRGNVPDPCLGAHDKELSDKMRGRIRQKLNKYTASAALLGQQFEACVVSHSGQWSSGLVRVVERAVSQYAERHGYQPGAVRSWWTAALCADAAKATAKLILTAADRMEDRLPQQGRHREGVHLDAIFREHAAAGILPPQAPVRVPGRQIAGLASAEPVLA